jgi:hypothetical protein
MGVYSRPVLRGVVQASIAIAAALLGCSVDKAGIYPSDASPSSVTTGVGGSQGGAAGAPIAGGAGTNPGGAAGQEEVAGRGDGGAMAGAGGNVAGGSGSSGAGGTAGGSPCLAYPSAQAFTPPGDDAHCYWFHAERYAWPDADYTCASEGGKLATILSSEENGFLAELAAMSSPTMTDFWIGGSDGRGGWESGGSGPFAWITGEPFIYQSWVPGQPDGTCQGCVASGPDGCRCDHRIALGADGRWSDDWAGALKGFLCEAVP